MNIQPADILLVSGTSLVDRAIETISHSEFSHAALFVFPTELLEAQFGRRIGYQDPGVYAGHGVVYTSPALTQRQRERIVRYAKQQIGYEYDVGLIFVELIRYTLGLMMPWKEFHSRICSTYVNGVYRDDGTPLTSVKYPSPGDLARSSFLLPVGKYI